jgi:hypothetical protein
MRKFSYAAVFAVAISAPAVAGAALMDHSVLSVLGAPDGGCSSSCFVGGADPNNPGEAEGGHAANSLFNGSGTIAIPGGQQTGHIEIASIFPGTGSGNFTTLPPKGHCTGGLSPNGDGRCS